MSGAWLFGWFLAISRPLQVVSLQSKHSEIIQRRASIQRTWPLSKTTTQFPPVSLRSRDSPGSAMMWDLWVKTVSDKTTQLMHPNLNPKTFVTHFFFKTHQEIIKHPLESSGSSASPSRNPSLPPGLGRVVTWAKATSGPPDQTPHLAEELDCEA